MNTYLVKALPSIQLAHLEELGHVTIVSTTSEYTYLSLKVDDTVEKWHIQATLGVIQVDLKERVAINTDGVPTDNPLLPLVGKKPTEMVKKINCISDLNSPFVQEITNREPVKLNVVDYIHR